MMPAEALSLETLAAKGREDLHPGVIRINVGLATCGRAAGAEDIFETLRLRIEQRQLKAEIRPTGCLGYCQKEPLVDVRLPGKGRILFTEMNRPRARALIDSLARGAFPGHLNPWAYINEEHDLISDEVQRFPVPDGLEKVPFLQDQPFFAPQKKIVLRNCGNIDPSQLQEYAALGGYEALASTLSDFSPQEAIEEITSSGLRGRGGGGFPTGQKWLVARDTAVEPKYIICNGDEGDPGAYMDRTILESDPHAVLEGMIIGAFAIGARHGFIYVRDEYPHAVEQVQQAIQQAQQAGFLGMDLLGSGFDFHVQLIRGAGAFVCGEETALISSIEGGIGEPRPKPPYPAVSGLWGKPTIINNVKTWATVPVIMARGAEWYSAIGSADNAGTVVFSLVGQIDNTGLVEVPLGMKIRDLIYGIGEAANGRSEMRTVKAVQTGGPSGGCLPERLFDMPIEYEGLKQAGSMMGSGGMVVLDETACMVDVARYFMDFTALESCGKCTACREGNSQLRCIMDRIVQGEGKPADLPLLEEVGAAVKMGSLCGLGQTAPNPVLSTLRYFPEEYEAHVIEHRCPAGRCSMTQEN